MRSAASIGQTYQAWWDGVKTECGRPSAASPRDELWELGLPATDKIIVWHALAANASWKDAPNRASIAPVGAAQVEVVPIRTRLDADGRPTAIDAGGASPFLTERFEFDGLAAGQTYTVTIGAKTLLAHTAPAQAETFSFVVTSCSNPFRRFDGEVGFEIARLNSLNLLRARTLGKLRYESLPTIPSFIVGLGDQVYVDGDNDDHPVRDPVGIFRGDQSRPVFDIWSHAERQKLLDVIYRSNMALPPWRDALEHVPIVSVWDDHEIRDGWGSHGDEYGPLAEYFADARDAFVAYQGLRNPIVPTRHRDAMDVQFSWSSFASFYLLDGRSHRYPGPAKRQHPIIDAEQMFAFKSWLDSLPREQAMVAVLGLPTPITSDQASVGQCSFLKPLEGEGADDVADTWPCNAADRDNILRALVEHFRACPKHRLLIVAGDVHYSSVSALAFPTTNGEKPPDSSIFGYEIVSSGIANDHVKKWTEKRVLSDGANLSDMSGAPLLFSQAFGSVFGGPSFAELKLSIVDGKPDIALVFYPSERSEGGSEDSDRALANDAITLAPSLCGGPDIVRPSPEYKVSEGSQKGAECKGGSPVVHLDFKTLPVATNFNCMHASSTICTTGYSGRAHLTDWIPTLPTGNTCAMSASGGVDRPR